MARARRIAIPETAAESARQHRRPSWRVTQSTAPAESDAAVVPLLPEDAGAAGVAHAAELSTPVEPVPAAIPRRRWARRVGIAAGLVALVVLGYAGWVGASLLNAEKQIYKPRPATPTRAVAQVTAAPATASPGNSVSLLPATPTLDPASGLPAGRINILILGTDKRANDPDHYARSDTMILANVDTINRKVRLMSMPRDLVAEIPGYGVNKINSAYMFGEYYHEPGGGQALAASMVSQWFNVPIDYYIAANFDGFRKVIDTLGGVDINVPYAIDDYHYPSDDEGDPFGEIHVHFDAGLQHMDGKTALRYARTRHADNDFMRNQRQMQVMVAARRAATQLNLIPKLPSIIDQLGGSIETDLPFDKQLAFARFGYSLQSSDIITSSITSEMIVPVTLDDGSEGLKLDTAASLPVLEDFFGMPITVSEAGSYSDSSVKSTSTATLGTGSYSGQKRRTSPTPAPAKSRTGLGAVHTPTPASERGTTGLPSSAP